MSDAAPVLITGASRGIGRSAAIALAAAGFDVLLWARSGPDLEEVADQCRAHGRRATIAQVDVGDPSAVEAEQQRSLAGITSLRGLILNAGIGVWGSLGQLTVAEWQAQQRVNLDGAFYALRATTHLLRGCRASQIVAIASDSSLFGYADRSAYCASKHGLLGLMESARRELRVDGVRITNLIASRVDTFFRGKKPGGRPEALSPTDVADVIVGLFQLPEKVELRELQLSAIGTTFGPFEEKARTEAPA